MKRPAAMAAVSAAATLAASGFTYAAKDQPFEIVMLCVAVLAAVFAMFGAACADE
ncbi:MAG: hypothetical protein QHC88_12870 [Achromobacter sp.]|uniref:hypothetical protein n=1 Tax=Achromobacter sp. TaxID=134375 RepID=UPI0029AB13CB|nr:hypothetical protein [Achromobacter sp.]MDX3986136.1 hypothetical protein [Achromobacter sp.]